MKAQLKVREVASLALLLAAGNAAAATRFVAANGGGSACTRVAPCALDAALSQSGAGDTIHVGAGTYTGSGTSLVTITSGLALLGGWNGAAAGAVVRDPASFVSILDGEDDRRVITVAGAGAPTIDGFTIKRGNATGLTANCDASAGQPDGCGGGIHSYQSNLTLTNNVITDNVAARSTFGFPTGTTGYGGGLYMSGADGGVVRDNVFVGNVASTVGNGAGGAIRLASCGAGTTLDRNTIAGNTAASAPSITGWGGGVALYFSNVLFADNVVEGNRASASDPWGQGAGVYGWYASATVRGNVVAGNGGAHAVYFGHGGPRLERNRIRANLAEYGLFLGYGDGSESVVENTVVEGASNFQVAIVASTGAPMSAMLRHNTVAGRGTGTGIWVGDGVTATVRNCIVAGSYEAVVEDSQSTLTLERTLFWDNTIAGTVGSLPLAGNPTFVNALAGDFRIRPGSAAQDLAIASGLSTDLEGQSRPLGPAPDIGADELPPRAFDFGTGTSPVANGFMRVAETGVYSAASGFGWKSGAVSSRERASGNSLRRDFNFSKLATFAVDLPPGLYTLTLTMGDTAAAHDQMGVLLEGALVDSVTTSGGQVVERRHTVGVWDGQLTLILDDLGGSDLFAVINALEIASAGVHKLDFGTLNSDVAPAFTQVTHASSYTPARGYGWVAGVVGSRDRGGSEPLGRDFNFTASGIFGIDVPGGEYLLRMLMGDLTFAHDHMEVTVEGATTSPFSTAAGELVLSTFRTGAADGQLTIALHDEGGGDPNVVVNALDLVPVDELRFDFGTEISPVEPSYTRVIPAATFRPSRGWGWVEGAVAARNRASGSPLARDFHFSADATFGVDLPNGAYSVLVTIGDSGHPHDLVGVYLEGALVDTVTTGAGEVITREYAAVAVADGQLTVRIRDLGGSDANATINGLRILP